MTLNGDPSGQNRLERRSDAVAQALALMIKSGNLRKGDRLPPERDLMRSYGVSRSAIREAIASLAHRGLVATRLGHRPVVRRPDYETAIGNVGALIGHLASDRQGIWNLFETRILFETALARSAAAKARRDDIEELRAALKRNRDAIGDTSRFLETDAAFHAVLYRIPGNPIYPAIHGAYVEWLTPHWRSMRGGAEIDQMNYAGHEAIFTAIETRDPDGAEQALTRHLVAAWEFVRSTLPLEKNAEAAGDGNGPR